MTRRSGSHGLGRSFSLARLPNGDNGFIKSCLLGPISLDNHKRLCYTYIIREQEKLLKRKDRMSKSNEVFYIKASNSGEGWIKTNSKTERGAKNIVSKMYRESVGNSMQVGISDGVDINAISIKSAFEAWRSI